MAKQLRKGILIAGMHRSGTSLLSGIICQIGAAAPASLMAANEFNEAGYWESDLIYRLNDRILSEIGSSWHDVLPIESTVFNSQQADRYVDDICAAIEHEYGSEEQICIKDPRLSRLLPLWLQALSRLDIDPYIIVSIRNPLDVASSLKRRNDFSLPRSQLLWFRYLTDCERHTRGLKRAFISYDDLLGDWRNSLTRLGNELGLEWANFNPRAAAQVERMVSHRYQHHSSSADELQTHPHVSSVVKAVFDSLLAASSGNRPDPTPRIAELTAQLNAIDSMYAEVLADSEFEIESSGQALATVRESVDAERSAREKAEALLANAQTSMENATQASAEKLAEQADRLKRIEAEHEALKQTVQTEKSAREKAEALLANAQTSMENATQASAEKLAEQAERLKRIEAEREALKQTVQTEKSAREKAEALLANAQTSMENATQASAEKLAEQAERLKRIEAEREALKQTVQTEKSAREKAEALLANAQTSMENATQASAEKLAEQAERLKRIKAECDTLVSEGSSKLESRAKELLMMTEMIRDSEAEVEKLRTQVKVMGDLVALTVDSLARSPLKKKKLDAVSKLLISSQLLDPEWYLEQNPDVAEAGIEPGLHYLLHGAGEGRAPCNFEGLSLQDAEA